MLSLKVTGDNRAELMFSGKVDAEGMRRIIDEFEMKLEGMQNVRLLYRIDDFEMPTLGAMMIKLGELPNLLKVMKRIDKIALVVDKKWMQKVADLEGILFPGLEIKGFGMDKLDAAERWLSQ